MAAVAGHLVLEHTGVVKRIRSLIQLEGVIDSHQVSFTSYKIWETGSQPVSKGVPLRLKTTSHKMHNIQSYTLTNLFHMFYIIEYYIA